MKRAARPSLDEATGMPAAHYPNDHQGRRNSLSALRAAALRWRRYRISRKTPMSCKSQLSRSITSYSRAVREPRAQMSCRHRLSECRTERDTGQLLDLGDSSFYLDGEPARADAEQATPNRICDRKAAFQLRRGAINGARASARA